MPVVWRISHPDRLVTAHGEGTIVLQDMERYLDDVVVSEALPYAKIFDLGIGTWALDDTDMLALGARIRAYPSLAKVGPLAIVAPSDALNAHAEMFATLADVQQPLRIFRDVTAARKWLADLARDGSGRA
jgi:hypothetical protein